MYFLTPALKDTVKAPKGQTKPSFQQKNMRISQTTEEGEARLWGGGVKGELTLSVMLHYFKRKMHSCVI